MRTSQVLATLLVAVCLCHGCTRGTTDPTVSQASNGNTIPIGSAPDAAKSLEPPKVDALTVSPDGWCSDLRPYASSLDDIDVPKTDFDGRLRCVAGDFDCNGSIDYAVTAYNGHLNPGGTIPGPYKVLFLEGTRVIRDVKIDISDLYLYKKTNQVGEFGEPASSCDGLIHPGEGGTTIILLFNRETGKFDETEHVSDRESD